MLINKKDFVDVLTSRYDGKFHMHYNRKIYIFHKYCCYTERNEIIIILETSTDVGAKSFILATGMTPVALTVYAVPGKVNQFCTFNKFNVKIIKTYNLLNS